MEKDLDVLVNETAVNFKRGTTALLILSLLTERDMYVYEIVKALRERSMGQMQLQRANLYMLLYSLRDKGLVSTWDEPVGRKTRVYYHILPKGAEYLRRSVAEYHAADQLFRAVLEKTGTT